LPISNVGSVQALVGTFAVAAALAGHIILVASLAELAELIEPL